MSSGASSSLSRADIAVVLDLWFGDCTDPANVDGRGRLWFASTEAQDRRIREALGGLHERAQRGELDHWTGEPRGSLALVVLLDQLTRNLYRGTASAFANDPRALEIARGAIGRELDRLLHVVERAFLYMPFQHSEALEDQHESLRLFEALLQESPAPFQGFMQKSYDYARLHWEIIERFGRFPHRNRLLGRPSTGEEARYLEDGGHRFGQG